MWVYTHTHTHAPISIRWSYSRIYLSSTYKGLFVFKFHFCLHFFARGPFFRVCLRKRCQRVSCLCLKLQNSSARTRWGEANGAVWVVNLSWIWTSLLTVFFNTGSSYGVVVDVRAGYGWCNWILEMRTHNWHLDRWWWCSFLGRKTHPNIIYNYLYLHMLSILKVTAAHIRYFSAFHY